MSQQNVNLLGVGAALVMLFVLGMMVYLPSRHRAVCRANRVSCAANLSGLYRSMYTYSNDCRGKFPIAGDADVDGIAVGFRDRRDGTRPEQLNNNVSASLWMMVLDGSVQTKQFTCPISGDDPDPLADGSGQNVDIQDTFDFFRAEHLSYSSLNMFGTTQRRQWGANVRAERILMADNNNAAGRTRSQLHTTTQNSVDELLTPQSLSANENSGNHGDGEGQNFLFGDGHAEFATDPFVGLSGDNAYAADLQAILNSPEIASMPTLENDQAWMVNFRRDSMLLPITGATGGRTTLDPSD
ncbi:MAG: hypothetical protein R3236_01185 [Phycisphaeraceae bacterium]|nr:hypothetical protein [Phycisphaeraceae bacterium]